MSEKKVIITGATGMVGGCALKICLEHPDVSMVTAIGRTPTGFTHTRLKEILIDEFKDYATLQWALENQDTALYCLGAYTGAVPDDLFRRITIDYPLAFANALRESSPQAAFCFLSGQGADQTERSRMSFARYKGAAENALIAMDFDRLHIFRPGYIYPATPRREPNLMNRISRILYTLLRWIYPNIGIASEDLAAAMFHAGLYGTGGNEGPILENKDIRSMAMQ